MPRRIQFSISLLLAIITIVAVSLAAIVQVPHVFVFALALGSVIFISLTAYRQAKNLWLRLPLLLVFIAAWFIFYVLSLGPFIVLCEFDRQLTGQHHIGRLAGAYRPVVIHFNNTKSFQWYVRRWIPPNAVGLHALYPPKILPEFIGTWQSDVASLVNNRADGTGRARFLPAGDQRLYFEWAADANEFKLYTWGSKQSAYAWFGREMMNRPWLDKLELIEVSEGQFKLRTQNGKVISFTKTQDAELEADLFKSVP